MHSKENKIPENQDQTSEPILNDILDDKVLNDESNDTEQVNNVHSEADSELNGSNDDSQVDEVSGKADSSTAVEHEPYEEKTNADIIEGPNLTYEELAKNLSSMEEKLAETVQQCDKYLRNIADRDDQIKRLENRIKRTERYGTEKLARDILTTYDNIGRALQHGQNGQDEGFAGFIEGVENIFRDFKKTLKRNSIIIINPESGDQFDPDLHEALYNIPLSGFEKGQIIQVEQIGFQLHDRLLRPAKVGVASGE